MSLLRLFALSIAMLAYLNSQAQKDSAIYSIAQKSSRKLDKTNNIISKYNKNTDSITTALQDIPAKYFKKIDKKIDTYSSRLTSKTEKTLTKLSKWENKIRKLLDKASPETSARLFSKNQITFTSLLQKVKQGESIAKTSEAKYDVYRDKLTTSLKYIETQKDKLNADVRKPVSEATDKMKELNQDVVNTDAVEKIIKERKKQLINESLKYIGKSKYLTKINKESYYYVETLKNYKEIFSDPKKMEQTAKTILNKIPAFKKFASQNSMLSSLFPGSSTDGSTAGLDGLQTRSDIDNLIQGKIGAGGPSANEAIQQSMQQAQSEMKNLKDKVLKAGGGNSSAEIPDFKPNEQKTKTFFQRLEYGFNYQLTKNNKLLPTTADISLTIGYKINNKSVIGIGAAYKMGLGTIDNIQISHQGIGLRSYIDWKLKKHFFVSGGFEMNHNAGFQDIKALESYNEWQQAGLIGISKKLPLKTKLTKGTKFSVLYDLLHRQHIPVSQPIVFRVGYNF